MDVENICDSWATPPEVLPVSKQQKRRRSLRILRRQSIIISNSPIVTSTLTPTNYDNGERESSQTHRFNSQSHTETYPSMCAPVSAKYGMAWMESDYAICQKMPRRRSVSSSSQKTKAPAASSLPGKNAVLCPSTSPLTGIQSRSARRVLVSQERRPSQKKRRRSSMFRAKAQKDRHVEHSFHDVSPVSSLVEDWYTPKSSFCFNSSQEQAMYRSAHSECRKSNSATDIFFSPIVNKSVTHVLDQTNTNANKENVADILMANVNHIDVANIGTYFPNKLETSVRLCSPDHPTPSSQIMHINKAFDFDQNKRNAHVSKLSVPSGQSWSMREMDRRLASNSPEMLRSDTYNPEASSSYMSDLRLVSPCDKIITSSQSPEGLSPMNEAFMEITPDIFVHPDTLSTSSHTSVMIADSILPPGTPDHVTDVKPVDSYDSVLPNIIADSVKTHQKNSYNELNSHTSEMSLEECLNTHVSVLDSGPPVISEYKHISRYLAATPNTLNLDCLIQVNQTTCNNSKDIKNWSGTVIKQNSPSFMHVNEPNGVCLDVNTVPCFDSPSISNMTEAVENLSMQINKVSYMRSSMEMFYDSPVLLEPITEETESFTDMSDRMCDSQRPSTDIEQSMSMVDESNVTCGVKDNTRIMNQDDEQRVANKADLDIMIVHVGSDIIQDVNTVKSQDITREQTCSAQTDADAVNCSASGISVEIVNHDSDDVLTVNDLSIEMTSPVTCSNGMCMSQSRDDAEATVSAFVFQSVPRADQEKLCYESMVLNSTDMTEEVSESMVLNSTDTTEEVSESMALNSTDTTEECSESMALNSTDTTEECLDLGAQSSNVMLKQNNDAKSMMSYEIPYSVMQESMGMDAVTIRHVRKPRMVGLQKLIHENKSSSDSDFTEDLESENIATSRRSTRLRRKSTELFRPIVYDNVLSDAALSPNESALSENADTFTISEKLNETNTCTLHVPDRSCKSIRKRRSEEVINIEELYGNKSYKYKPPTAKCYETIFESPKFSKVMSSKCYQRSAMFEPFNVPPVKAKQRQKRASKLGWTRKSHRTISDSKFQKKLKMLEQELGF